jgi:hypothetical protein
MKLGPEFLLILAVVGLALSWKARVSSPTATLPSITVHAVEGRP